MDKLDPDDSRPPYLQVVDALRRQVYEGVYAPGDKLPALPTLATGMGVSINTVRRALTQLQEEQVIVTRQGQGSFVRSELPELPAGQGGGELAPVLEQLATIRRLVDSVERQLRTRG